jgi:hypothetical protein
MEHSDSPNALETLRHHFSRRASAARIAQRKLRANQPMGPAIDKPTPVISPENSQVEVVPVR